MPDGEWFYARAGQQHGPMPTDEVARLLAGRELAATDLVWREGMASWMPAGDVPEFSREAAQAGGYAAATSTTSASPVQTVLPAGVTAAPVQPVPSRTLGADWFYAKDGAQQGPVTLETVQLMAASGQLAPTDLVWAEGLPEWAPAAQVPEVSSQTDPRALYAASAPEGQLGYYNYTAAAGAASVARLPTAGFWIRVGAYIIDYIILFIPGQVLQFGLEAAFRGVGPTAPNQNAFVFSVMGFGIAASVSINWLYFALMESSSKQATLGKMACGLKVTDMRGERITFGRATGRYFGKILSGVICYIGFIMVGFDERNQGLHDQMARTLVIRR